MIGLTILLVLVAAMGCLPLVLFLVKRNTYRRLSAKGQKTTACISNIKPGARSRNGLLSEKIHYSFYGQDGLPYTGMFVSAPKKHRLNESLEVYYMPHDPRIHAVRTTGYGIGYFIFLLAIALGVSFMMFKVYQMTNQPGN
jgi:hypothetical protein